MRYENTDCLWVENLHYMTTGTASYFEICKQWCADHNDCAGFTGLGERCFFKSRTCVRDLFRADKRDVYLKQKQ